MTTAATSYENERASEATGAEQADRAGYMQLRRDQDEAIRTLEAWAADLDLDALAGDEGVAALVAGWRAIECADERTRVEREQIGVAIEGDWPTVSREWHREGVDWVIERLYEAAEVRP